MDAGIEYDCVTVSGVIKCFLDRREIAGYSNRLADDSRKFNGDRPVRIHGHRVAGSLRAVIVSAYPSDADPRIGRGQQLDRGELVEQPAVRYRCAAFADDL